MILSVLCPRCGELTKWDSKDEPLKSCSACGYELSVENEYGERIWKRNVRAFEDEVLKLIYVLRKQDHLKAKKCKFCPCIFETKEDLDKHMERYGNDPETHKRKWRKDHEELERTLRRG